MYSSWDSDFCFIFKSQILEYFIGSVWRSRKPVQHLAGGGHRKRQLLSPAHLHFSRNRLLSCGTHASLLWNTVSRKVLSQQDYSFQSSLHLGGTTVMKFWPLGCQGKSCISLPSLVIGTACLGDWSYSLFAPWWLRWRCFKFGSWVIMGNNNFRVTLCYS